jgi:hypothetical protein
MAAEFAHVCGFGAQEESYAVMNTEKYDGDVSRYYPGGASPTQPICGYHYVITASFGFIYGVLQLPSETVGVFMQTSIQEKQVYIILTLSSKCP